ncbi:reverse transcriptase family protein [Ideonella paludis]|uniref:reverse transcriptase family protein n=1 Tax=Ideonella paludis TaxID=1233411 RepID=UPI0036444CCE
MLPQGAPTSPMLTNILCRKLDRRLQGLADKLGFTYTRYADDLTFSASEEGATRVGSLLRQVHHVLRSEGFTPHPDKQRVMRQGARQEVTGVVVNAKPSVSRTERRKLRAALHRAKTQGLAAATWQGQAASRDVLVGYARFVRMVSAPKAKPCCNKPWLCLARRPQRRLPVLTPSA